jgi:hypothetical protein
MALRLPGVKVEWEPVWLRQLAEAEVSRAAPSSAVHRRGGAMLREAAVAGDPLRESMALRERTALEVE